LGTTPESPHVQGNVIKVPRNCVKAHVPTKMEDGVEIVIDPGLLIVMRGHCTRVRSEMWKASLNLEVIPLLESIVKDRPAFVSWIQKQIGAGAKEIVSKRIKAVRNALPKTAGANVPFARYVELAGEFAPELAKTADSYIDSLIHDADGAKGEMQIEYLSKFAMPFIEQSAP
jgi:hypothetical protein